MDIPYKPGGLEGLFARGYDLMSSIWSFIQDKPGGLEEKMRDCGDMKLVRQVSASLNKRNPVSIDKPSTQNGGAIHFKLSEDPHSQNLNIDSLDIIMDFYGHAKPNGQAYPIYAEGSQIKIGQIYQIPDGITTIKITKKDITH